MFGTTEIIAFLTILLIIWLLIKIFKKDSPKVAKKVGQEAQELIEAARSIPKAFNEGLKEARESVKETKENIVNEEEKQ